MNCSLAESSELLDKLRENAVFSTQVELAVMPSYVHLPLVSERLSDSFIGFGAQDVSAHESGAFTGEVSATMLTDLGCQYAIVGHSERRQGHSESNKLVAKKAARALTCRLKPIVCVGETLEQRERGDAQVIVSQQLKSVLAAIEPAQLDDIVVAYEPVWAIGTGLTASPEQAQSMHAHIREILCACNVEAGQGVRILYGGSVKPDNAKRLFAQRDVNGALVGGAALDADAFLKIHEIARDSICTE